MDYQALLTENHVADPTPSVSERIHLQFLPWHLLLILKPVLDWQQDGRTGAVGELEIGWDISRHWGFWLMLGTRVWGGKVPSTYDQRVGITGAYQF